MNLKQVFAATVLAAASFNVSANPFVEFCSNLADVAEGSAELRDQGFDKSYVESILNDIKVDGPFEQMGKNSSIEVAKQVYNYPDLSPRRAAIVTYQGCMSAF